MKYHIPRQLLFGWVLSLLMIGATYWIETFPPKFTEFYEGDIALSYSVHDTVPYKYVILSCFVLPTILLCLFVWVCNPKEAPVWIHDILFLAVRSYAFNEIVIVTIKNFIGRPRPCFFQLCQYEKNVTYLPTGEAIVTYGTLGVLGNVSKCHGSKQDVYNAFRSFPSGHSATSMNGLFTVLQLLFLFIDSTFTLKQYQVRYTKSLFAIPFVTWVCFILGSRIFDYRHRPEDVIGGMVFGVLSSFFVVRLFHPSTRMIKRVVTDKSKLGFSHYFSDITESIINVYSPVSKPESAIV